MHVTAAWLMDLTSTKEGLEDMKKIVHVVTSATLTSQVLLVLVPF